MPVLCDHITAFDYGASGRRGDGLHGQLASQSRTPAGAVRAILPCHSTKRPSVVSLLVYSLCFSRAYCVLRVQRLISRMVQEADGDYFSMERMRERCPLLFHEFCDSAAEAPLATCASLTATANAHERPDEVAPTAATSRGHHKAAGVDATHGMDSQRRDERVPVRAVPHSSAGAGPGCPQGPSRGLEQVLDAIVQARWLRDARAQQVRVPSACPAGTP